MNTSPHSLAAPLICQPIPRWQRVIIGWSCALQGALIAFMGKLSWLSGLLTIILLALLGTLMVRYLECRRRHLFWSMSWAMLALGNLGMLLGWMADYDFGPIIRGDLCLCGCPKSPLGQGLIQHVNWMHMGMLLASLPCLIIIRPPWIHRKSTSWQHVWWGIHGCCCFSGMLLGMVGATWLMTGIPISDPTSHFIYTVIAMSIGMGTGMMLGCHGWKLWLGQRQPSTA